MKVIRPSDTLAGLLALACAATVVLATAFEAAAGLGPAVSAPSAAAAPALAAVAR